MDVFLIFPLKSYDMCLKKFLSIFFFAHFYPSITLVILFKYTKSYTAFLFIENITRKKKEWWAKVVVYAH